VSVLADLARLESRLSMVEVVGESRRAITSRLRSMLANWIEGNDGQVDTMQLIDDWETPDKIFEFIDSEFGGPEAEERVEP
jgi:hypothetical protein